MKKKIINEEVSRMQEIAGIDPEPQQDYSHMDNDELLAVLDSIRNTYSNPELDNMDWKGISFHLGKAIDLIKARTSN